MSFAGMEKRGYGLVERGCDTVDGGDVTVGGADSPVRERGVASGVIGVGVVVAAQGNERRDTELEQLDSILSDQRWKGSITP